MKFLNTIFAVIFFSPFQIVGQQNIRLNKDCKVDTIYVFLQQTDSSDYELINELQTKFNSIVANFNNQSDRVFKLIIDSSYSTNSVKFLMGKIKYVDCKRRIFTATIDIIGIGINILIFPYFPPIVPFYLMPSTYCKVDIITTDDLACKNGKLFINPNGTFVKKETQKKKFSKKFDKRFNKFFAEIDRQYKIFVKNEN